MPSGTRGSPATIGSRRQKPRNGLRSCPATCSRLACALQRSASPPSRAARWSLVQPVHINVRQQGGHFGPWENPEAYGTGICSTFGPFAVRTGSLRYGEPKEGGPGTTCRRGGRDFFALSGMVIVKG